MGPESFACQRRTLLKQCVAVLGVSALALMTGAAYADDPVTLKLWLESRGTPDKISDALTDFTAKTGIKVERFDFGHDSTGSGLSKVIGTDLFPDVWIGYPGIGLAQQFLDANQAEVLNKYYDQYGWDKESPPGGVAVATFDGNKMAVPFTSYGMGFWYKKSAFEKAGIAGEPKTWDEMLADFDKLVAVGIQPLSFGGTQPWDPMRLMDVIFEHTCGAETFDALRDLKVDFSKTPCAKDSFQTFADWSDKYMVKGWTGLDPSASQQYGPIFNGQAAMTLDPSTAGSTLTSQGQKTADYGAFALPTGTGRAYTFGEGLWISATSQHKDEAAKLIDFLISKDVQEKYAGGLRTTIPANVDANLDANLDDFAKNFNQIVQAGLKVGAFIPSDQAFPKVLGDSFERYFMKVGFKQMTADEAVAAMQTDIDNYKAQQ